MTIECFQFSFLNFKKFFLLNCLISILFFFFNFLKVFAIDCYQCVSTNVTDSVGCRTPFDQWNTPYIKQCKQSIAGSSQEAYACVKIVQTIGKF